MRIGIFLGQILGVFMNIPAVMILIASVARSCEFETQIEAQMCSYQAVV